MMKNSIPARLIRRGVFVSLLVVVLAGPVVAGDMSTGAEPPPAPTAAGGHIATPLTAEAQPTGGEIQTTDGEIQTPLTLLLLSLLGAALLP